MLASGSVQITRTVRSSTTSARSTPDSCLMYTGISFSMMKLKEKATSFAVICTSSCQTMPSFRVRVQSRPSSETSQLLTMPESSGPSVSQSRPNSSRYPLL